MDQITETNGKAAFVWILGQFGEHIEDAPYILEKLIEEEQEVSSISLNSYIVVACTRLFLKRAPEMHGILASYFKQVL